MRIESEEAEDLFARNVAGSCTDASVVVPCYDDFETKPAIRELHSWEAVQSMRQYPAAHLNDSHAEPRLQGQLRPSVLRRLRC